MIWTGRADEAAALGLLLDRTYADAAAAAEHPRLLDREFLIGQFDLWDNHLLPAVDAGTAPPWIRRSAARAVWQRLGFVAGADHRRWMADHLDDLGLDPLALLGAERADQPPFRSADGRLCASAQPLTAEAAELIRADYDLTGGVVLGARVDAHGPDPQRIGGFLKVSAGSRRYTETPAPPPELHFRFGDATSAGFPQASARLAGQPEFVATDDQISLEEPGADLRLAGRDITWYPDDALWAESAAARAAGEGVREPAPELSLRSSRSSDLLGILQHMLMIQLRMMRHAHLLRRWELAAAATLCGGLNAELFRVQPATWRARWAARRMRTILATDDGPAHALLRHLGRRGHLDVPERPGAVSPPAPVRITVGTAGRLLGEVDFTGGRLRFVDVEDGRTVIHLDVRHAAGRETIVVVVLTEPLGRAPLTVTPGGLALTRRPTLEATADDIALTIPLPGGDWTPRAAAGSWYVD
jgi:hypothetical protein